MKVLKNKIGLIITALILITVTFFSTYSFSSASAFSRIESPFFYNYNISKLPDNLVPLNESHRGTSFDRVKIYYSKDSVSTATLYFTNYKVVIDYDHVAIWGYKDINTSTETFLVVSFSSLDSADCYGYFYINNSYNLYNKSIIFERADIVGDFNLYVSRTVGHTYEYIEEVPPTCQESGVSAHYYCSHCDKTFDLEYFESTDFEIPMLPDHVYTWIDEKPATVNSVGIKGHYVCQYCDLTFDKDYLQITDLTIPKLELQTTNSGLSLANAIALYAGLHLIVFVIALVVAKISKKRK